MVAVRPEASVNSHSALPRARAWVPSTSFGAWFECVKTGPGTLCRATSVFFNTFCCRRHVQVLIVAAVKPLRLQTGPTCLKARNNGSVVQPAASVAFVDGFWNSPCAHVAETVAYISLFMRSWLRWTGWTAADP